MTLTEALTGEHALIERVVGALQTYVARRLAGAAGDADAARFFRFFRTWVGGYHHEREEQVLFRALTEGLGLPADRGPVAALVAQHHTLAADLDALEERLAALAAQPVPEPTLHAAIAALTTRYTHGLWQHIDAEDSVLFPESTARLRRGGLQALPSRAPNDDERAARDDGARLVDAYPPAYDPSAVRGDGCPACPSYGTTCDGLERAWWTDSEWSELGDHLG